MWSAEEVQKMAPVAREEFVKQVGQYLATIKPYVPLATDANDSERLEGAFVKAWAAQRAKEYAAVWDEGYHAGHECVGAEPDCKRTPNPYRSES